MMHKGQTVTVTLTVELPVDATKKQVNEWLCDSLDPLKKVNGNNPLARYNITASGIDYQKGDCNEYS